MRPVSADEMRRLDQTAIEKFHIPSLVLMENAGQGVSKIIARDYKPCRVTIFVGKGNNGGDGFVVARHLHRWGFSVMVLMAEDPARLKPDPLVNYQLVVNLAIPILRIFENNSLDSVAKYCSEAELIVDALFGVGLNSELQGIFSTCVQAINAANRPVVSIDIPSGLDADSGHVHGAAVKATCTVTLAISKHGLFIGLGPEYTGKIETVDIGIPRELMLPYFD